MQQPPTPLDRVDVLASLLSNTDDGMTAERRALLRRWATRELERRPDIVFDDEVFARILRNQQQHRSDGDDDCLDGLQPV